MLKDCGLITHCLMNGKDYMENDNEVLVNGYQLGLVSMDLETYQSIYVDERGVMEFIETSWKSRSVRYKDFRSCVICTKEERIRAYNIILKTAMLSQFINLKQ